jgi:asparagine synthase (glutamine-hydrolysing)
MLRRLHLRPHDGSTFFRDIAEVPPAHAVVVTGNRIDAARYWDFDETTSGAKTFSEYAEEFRHHFNTAVRRRMRSTESVAVSLSGGVDSSSIFCVGHALAGNGTLPPNGFTYTSDDGSAADEGRFVCEVERHTGRTIQRVAMPVPAMLQGLLDQVRQAESPMVDAQHNRTEHFQRTVQASGATVLLTGHFGDQILFNTAYLVDLFRRGSWRQMRTHLTAYRYWFPDAEPGEFLRAFRSDVFQLMLPDWMRRAINTARGHSHTPLDDCFSDRFRTEGAETSCDADRARKTRTTAMAADLYRQVRSRYHCLCLDLNNKSSAAMGLEMAFPFLDRDLVDFVLRVPGEMLARNGEPKALLREALKGVVPDAILRRNTKGDFTHIVNEGTRRDYDRIDQVLGPESLIVQLGYVDPLKLSRGIASVKSGIGRTASSTASWQLRSLLALEMWLRAFPGNQKETLQWTSHAN